MYEHCGCIGKCKCCNVMLCKATVFKKICSQFWMFQPFVCSVTALHVYLNPLLSCHTVVDLARSLSVLPSRSLLSAQYPCDIVTMLHVVLFRTGDPDHHMRERAVQLLQVLHR